MKSGEDGQIVDPNIVGKNIVVRAIGGNIIQEGVFFGTSPKYITVDTRSGAIQWKGSQQSGVTYKGESVPVAKVCIVYEYGWF
nr:MAG TPA: hypothetical protein [Caudoviricetes sp.]